VLLSFFGIVVLLQIMAPAISSKPAYRAWAVHIRNGLYLNAIFDRLVGAFNLSTNQVEPTRFDGDQTLRTR
jgi:NAD(P)H-quinone oxidoreductase subunit 5